MEQSKQKIWVHLGTYNGSIIGFYGDVGALENSYAYSPNQVNSF
jgi:hypothetical protein